jgi:hypothetical protein
MHQWGFRHTIRACTEIAGCRKEPSYDGDARSPEYDYTTIMPPAMRIA